ncbi:MAG: hypothetical protein WC565_00080 [Parcubacteria group bacterium]
MPNNCKSHQIGDEIIPHQEYRSEDGNVELTVYACCHANCDMAFVLPCTIDLRSIMREELNWIRAEVKKWGLKLDLDNQVSKKLADFLDAHG